MATVRWCRDAGATDASSPLPVLFRRSPRQAGTVRPRLTSKMVWTLKKPKPYGLRDSTPTIPRSSRRRPCPMGTLARRLSHRTRPTGVRAPCPGHTKHTFLAELGAARLKAFEASARPG